MVFQVRRRRRVLQLRCLHDTGWIRTHPCPCLPHGRHKGGRPESHALELLEHQPQGPQRAVQRKDHNPRGQRHVAVGRLQPGAGAGLRGHRRVAGPDLQAQLVHGPTAGDAVRGRGRRLHQVYPTPRVSRAERGAVLQLRAAVRDGGCREFHAVHGWLGRQVPVPRPDETIVRRDALRRGSSFQR